jgi:feruloyl esterase
MTTKKKRRVAGVLTLWLASQTIVNHGAGFLAQTIDARVCQPSSLERVSLDNASIRSIETVPPGGLAARGAQSVPGLPAFCRVQAIAPDSLINFEVWIPSVALWNGKLVTTGNGGYGNALSYRDMSSALLQGYAAVGGDTGHQTATSDDLLWGVGHPERITDWGSRSIHAIVEPARLIVSALQGKPVRRSYFNGCSTGGHQGYAEIQRYPADFDGVIAGAPGNNRVRLNVGFLWQFLANHQRPDNATPIIPASKLPLITKAVVAACDANDGVADGVVDDPRTCRFDPATLLCPAEDQAGCLTAAQGAALNKMYAGARNPRTGEQIYPGWPKSSEALTVSPGGAPQSGWQQYWGGSEPTRANFWRHWVFENAKWDWWTLDFDRDLELADRRVGGRVDQTNPDISAFKARGGKAIVYNGWQDPVVNPLDTIAYYEKVKARQGSQAQIDSFFRLFLVPGMGHCSGGPGATNFGNQAQPPVVDADHDLLSALDAWVEKGSAPDRIIASRVVNGAAVRTRPLCRYPTKAVYTGSGSTDTAANFVCR